MIAALIVLGAALIVVLLLVRLFVNHIRECEDAMSLERLGWVEERRELLNRIQRPEYVPTAPAFQFEVPEPEPDGIEEVGTIVFDPEAVS